MNAFLVEANLLTDKSKIREMWADHFKSYFDSSTFDNEFCHRVTTRVHDILKTFTDDHSGALCKPLEYEEVAHVCSRLKPGVASISIEHMNIFAMLVPHSGKLYFFCTGFFESVLCVKF